MVALIRSVIGVLVGAPLGILFGTLYYLWLRLLNIGKAKRLMFPVVVWLERDTTWILNARGLKPSAITFGHTIFSRTREVWEDLREHEHTHVRQYEKRGWIGFLARYGYEMVKYGRRNAPLEVEARQWRT